MGFLGGQGWLAAEERGVKENHVCILGDQAGLRKQEAGSPQGLGREPQLSPRGKNTAAGQV